ncbi:uncharacterized protein N7511_000731 [Penicillium nucicola]|uniref:uncharacterized protein n=1 Tax=Penicillium nucicola TaxID=1850975 RepID=UPI0025456F36|nr:uncharacterized protein N7511_000731 [Penicillium nucicola]KAJ5775720.1 hypothetical protein N7511_000731 [Penicillium nucicola]
METPQEPKSSPGLSSRHPSIAVLLASYGRSNGPFVPSEEQKEKSKILAFNIRHLPNPPRKLRAMTTGLSPRLRKEFLKNEVVQQFLSKTYDEVVQSFTESYHALLPRELSIKNENDKGTDGELGDTSEDADMSFIVTVCCEEGRHRSVAFVEELAQRLSLLRNGSDVACWELNVNVLHRDIEEGILPDSSNPTAQKASAKGRSKGGKDARRINQKNSMFAEPDEIV